MSLKKLKISYIFGQRDPETIVIKSHTFFKSGGPSTFKLNKEYSATFNKESLEHFFLQSPRFFFVWTWNNLKYPIFFVREFQQKLLFVY